MASALPPEDLVDTEPQSSTSTCGSISANQPCYANYTVPGMHSCESSSYCLDLGVNVETGTYVCVSQYKDGACKCGRTPQGNYWASGACKYIGR